MCQCSAAISISVSLLQVFHGDNLLSDNSIRTRHRQSDKYAFQTLSFSGTFELPGRYATWLGFLSKMWPTFCKRGRFRIWNVEF